MDEDLGRWICCIVYESKMMNDEDNIEDRRRLQ